MSGEQAIFNLEIKKKSGLSLNPDIHHSKVRTTELHFNTELWSHIKTNYEMSFSKPTDNEMLQVFSFELNNYMELYKTGSTYFMVFLFFQLLRFMQKSIKPIKKLSRRHIIKVSG